MSEPDSTSSSRSLSNAPHANAEPRSPSDDARSTEIPVSGERVNGNETPDDQTVISGGPPLASHVDPLGLYPLDDIQAFEGQMLGHFRIERFVGGGGMGAVYRALDTRLNRLVAVKILSAEPYSDEDVERRFKNEAQSAARLDHENIARVYYFGVERGVHFIAFEFIDGINVRDLVVQRGPLPLAEAVSYTLQVADALAHASRRDVVHRDIKPSNVLVTSEGRAKLVDMGLARLHQVECSGEDLTASGVTLGTFDYISPEQARDPRNADIRSDLYSLGCTLFYMLTGQPPFPEGTVLQKLLRHQGDDAPDPRDLRGDLPEDVAEIVRRLLAKLPEDRYPEPESLIKALLIVARRVGLPAAAPGGTVWVTTDITHESWLRRHFPWMAPTALLVICVLLIEVLWPANQVLPLSQTAVGSGARNRREAGEGPSRNAAGSAPQPENDSVRRSRESGSKRSGPGLAETRRQSKRDSIRAPDVGPVLPAAVESSADGTKADGTKIAGRHRSGGSIRGGAEVDDARGPTPPVAEPSADVIVVEPGDEGNSQRSYDSLRAAVRDAASGDVIELRFNGRRSETPFKLINKRLTIRAGKGFRPHVVFRLEPDDVYPGRSSQSMVSLLGGDLTLVNVHLEMEVPRGTTSESVSLLETRGAESVHLDRCWLTVVNEHDYEGVAFLDVKGAPGGEATNLGPEQTPEKPVKIRLENCVARGEATFVYSAEMQPIDLFWRNGFLATSQRFLELDTGRLVHHASGRLQVDLQYVTAIVQGGFMLVDGGEVGRSVPVEVAVRDSILVGDRLSPLIELYGAGRSALLRRSIVWQGDRNFYEGFRDFWLLQDAGEERPLHIDFEEWAEAWKADRYGHDNRPHDGVVVWQSLPPADALPHRFTPDDFLLLDDVPGNPARGAAGDGSDAGFRQELWPPDKGNGSLDATNPTSRAAPDAVSPVR